MVYPNQNENREMGLVEWTSLTEHTHLTLLNLFPGLAAFEFLLARQLVLFLGLSACSSKDPFKGTMKT